MSLLTNLLKKIASPGTICLLFLLFLVSYTTISGKPFGLAQLAELTGGASIPDMEMSGYSPQRLDVLATIASLFTVAKASLSMLNLGLILLGLGWLAGESDINKGICQEYFMSNKILVTYATCTGSTVAVAEAIGKTLSDGGVSVDVLPMREVKDLSPYRAVVAGSAIQGKRWLPEAMQFVRAHQAELARKPFAAFLVCMTLAMRNGETYRSHVAEFLAPVRTLLKPVSEGCFAGALDIAKIPSLGDRLKFRLSVLFGVWTEGDHRDWDAIRAWAEGLRPRL